MMMPEGFFRKTLLTAQHKRELVCLYCDPGNLDRFHVGYISAVRDEDFTLEEITHEGLGGGLSVRQIEDIVRIDQGSRYAAQIALLMENPGALDDEEPHTGEEIGIPPTDCLTSVLERALASKVIVKFYIETMEDDDIIFGVVSRVSESCVQIEVLTEDGEPDGLTTIPLEVIHRIRVDGRPERKLALLNRHRTHLYL